mgnify:CR=1 FL=1
MENSVLISIVIPTFNNGLYLTRSLASVLSQTYRNFEVLIIDNHSTDNTSEIIKDANDSRINHYKIKNNGIISKSRNMGIKLSKGEWIAFLDSDDYWYATRLELLVNNIIHNSSIHVMTTNEYKVYENAKNMEKLFYGYNGIDNYKSLLLFGNRLSTSATIVNREFINTNKIFFDERLSFVTVEDYDFWLKLAFYKAKFKFIQSFQGEYLMHSSNESSKAERHHKNLINLLDFHVYNVQNFEKNKNKLWNQVKSSRQIIELLKSKYFKILIILNTIFKAPLFNIIFIFKKLSLIIQDEFRYLFNKH